ncbi:MAG: alpha/beta fold hydrolase [Rhodospirillales bacterium]
MQLTVNGAGVYLHTGGRPFDPKPPAALFVHGAGLDHTVWALQARYVAHHGFSVLAPDLPGHGRSEGKPLASIEAVADWLAALMDAAGLKTAALIGHSMGAAASLELAARHPERVARLILLGVAPRLAVHPDLLAAAENDPALARELIVDWAHGGRGRVGGNPAPGLWIANAARRLIDRAGASGALARDLKACEAWTGGQAAAARLACPALLILGAEDRMTPAKSGRQLGASIKGAEVAVLPDCGHMLMVEQPDMTLDRMRRFLGAQ